MDGNASAATAHAKLLTLMAIPFSYGELHGPGRPLDRSYF